MTWLVHLHVVTLTMADVHVYNLLTVADEHVHIPYPIPPHSPLQDFTKSE